MMTLGDFSHHIEPDAKEIGENVVGPITDQVEKVEL